MVSPKKIMLSSACCRASPCLPIAWSEHLRLGPQVLDDFLPLTIDPIRQNQEQELPRLEDEIHGGRITILRYGRLLWFG